MRLRLGLKILNQIFLFDTSIYMKTCSTCKVEKSLSEFGKRAASKDGLNASCRSCAQLRDRERYRKEAKRRSLKHKEYMQTEEGKRAHAAAIAKWRGFNPMKRAAHVLVGNRVKNGQLAKKSCQMCGTEIGVHAHHDDYSKPLDVMWLCTVHHKARHAFLDYMTQKKQEAA